MSRLAVARALILLFISNRALATLCRFVCPLIYLFRRHNRPHVWKGNSSGEARRRQTSMQGTHSMEWAAIKRTKNKMLRYAGGQWEMRDTINTLV